MSRFWVIEYKTPINNWKPLEGCPTRQEARELLIQDYRGDIHFKYRIRSYYPYQLKEV